jgi:hypothetical protein
MDWFKGKFAGKSHISWEHLWFPVDFPLNQSIETSITLQPVYLKNKNKLVRRCNDDYHHTYDGDDAEVGIST